MNAHVSERLSSLAHRADPALTALWIETLSPEEALAELFGRDDYLSLLQRARFLLDLGRAGDAEEVLGELKGLPAGLAELREELLGSATGGAGDASDQESPVLASATLAALHASQGDQDAAISMYRTVLERDPSNPKALGGLRKLTGSSLRREEELLEAWLQRVRRWRAEHSV